MSETTPLSPRRLNRATLARQLLLERHELDVETAVGRIAAIQAQAPASPYLALRARVAGFVAEDLDVAIRDATLVKASLMRITLHLVRAEDHGVLHHAMQPTLRGARLGDRRYTDTGLEPADADGIVSDLLEQLRTPHTNAEAEAWVRERFGDAGQWAWWALRHYAPLRHHPMGEPWSFGARPSFVATATPPPVPADRDAADVALRTLVLRYLAAFGPATLADIAQFGLVQRGRVRVALAALGDEVVRRTGADGQELLDVPGGALPDEDVRAPGRLLPMWDSTLLAYHDRSRVLPEVLRRVVIRRNGDVLPAVLVDGHVVGVWRTLGEDADVEVTTFAPVDAASWDDLEVEAASVRELLTDRDPTPYRRYDRWWDQLPRDGAEVRRLTG